MVSYITIRRGRSIRKRKLTKFHSQTPRPMKECMKLAYLWTSNFCSSVGACISRATVIAPNLWWSAERFRTSRANTCLQLIECSNLVLTRVRRHQWWYSRMNDWSKSLYRLRPLIRLRHYHPISLSANREYERQRSCTCWPVYIRSALEGICHERDKFDIQGCETYLRSSVGFWVSLSIVEIYANGNC